jgi:flavorubredoxin
MASAVVVYESVFGDAEKIARAIAEGLSRHLDVDVVAAKDAPQELGSTVRLLVVGGPNHAMSMPRPATREGAVKQYGAEIADTTTGLHEWLDAATVPSHISAAAFDTRMDHPKLVTKMDHASRTEEKLLHRLGATLAAPAEHFHVVDAKGPLAHGEEDRARLWGAALAEIVTAGTRR